MEKNPWTHVYEAAISGLADLFEAHDSDASGCAGAAKNAPLNIGAQDFAAHTEDALDARAVLDGDTSDAPLLHSVGAGCLDGVGESGQATGLGDRVVKCSVWFHGPHHS